MHEQMIHHPEALLNAVDVVLSWDLTDEGFCRALGRQALLMTGGLFD